MEYVSLFMDVIVMIMSWPLAMHEIFLAIISTFGHLAISSDDH